MNSGLWAMFPTILVVLGTIPLFSCFRIIGFQHRSEASDADVHELVDSRVDADDDVDSRVDADDDVDSRVDADDDIDSRVDADDGVDSRVDVEALEDGDSEPECSPTSELCNGEDDDCDGVVDNGLDVVLDPNECGGLPLEGVSQIAGISWDRGYVVRAARLVVGTPQTCCSSSQFGAGLPELDLSFTFGVLLGFDSGDGSAFYGRFPGIGETPGANIDRQVYEADWGDEMTLHNGPGDDLVVYEISTPEPFSLQVRTPAGWSPRRYAFSTVWDETHGTNGTVFDLTDFGLAEGEWIDAIRLENTFNSNALGGADRVDGEDGQGAVVKPEEPGYELSHPLLVSLGGREYEDDELDTDLIWITALHPIVPALCCIR